MLTSSHLSLAAESFKPGSKFLGVFFCCRFVVCGGVVSRLMTRSISAAVWINAC